VPWHDAEREEGEKREREREKISSCRSFSLRREKRVDALLSESESVCDSESASDSESEIGLRGRASESDSASVSSPCEGAKRDGSRAVPKRPFGYSRH